MDRDRRVFINAHGLPIREQQDLIAVSAPWPYRECMYPGPWRLIRAVVPHMRKRRYGITVHSSTGGSLEGRDTMGPYAGAKAGLNGITGFLAKEVAPYNIQVLPVILGTFNTYMVVNTIVGKDTPSGD
ncbi:hypothetical protein F5B19DRAFT_330299 [Rostrohypoxylon terebratum]|nr:hypothetical protein F5B19DRAFT_330299 [Rostrohypoxylon terebratum]